MASKQLGKLRQWGREVISSKDKTVLTEEFKQIEQDIELRRNGIQRLHTACAEFHGYLHKKKEYPNVEEGVKMLAIDALGAVMMSHGEEFGDDSAFGQCLIKYGRAHCKIATLQESFSLTFRDTYLASLAGSLEELDDYSTQRKKLDSRRLAYDSAVTKANKAKKDKEVKEAEEELNKAKLRYEETSTDVQVRMRVIQENEFNQLRDLTELLSNEIEYVSRYLDVLKETQEDWPDESNIRRPDNMPTNLAPHSFAFSRQPSTISSTVRTMTPPARRSRSSQSNRGRTSLDEDEVKGTEEAAAPAVDEFGMAAKRRASPVQVHSRSSSRGSMESTGTVPRTRRRGDSVGSEGGGAGGGGNNKRSGGVASWASSAVSSLSVPGLGKKEKVKDKDKDKSASRGFASLENASEDEGEDDRLRRRDDALQAEADLQEVQRQAFGTPFHSLNLGKMLGTGNSSGSGGSGSSSAHHHKLKPINSHSSSSGSSFASVAAPATTSGSSIMYTSSLSQRAQSRIPPSLPPQRTLSTQAPPTQTDIARRAAAEMDATFDDATSILSEDMYDSQIAVRLPVYDEPFGDHHFAKSPMSIDSAHHPRHPHDGSYDSVTEDDEAEEERRGLFESATSVSRTVAAPPGQNQGTVGNVAGNGVFINSLLTAPTTNTARLPPALPQRKQSVKKAPPPPPPPPARRIMTTGAIGTMNANANLSNGSVNATSSSAPVSTASSSLNVPSVGVPSLPRRPTSRTSTEPITDSPFEN